MGTAVALAGDAMTSSLAKIETAIGRSATSAQEASTVYESLYEVGRRTGVGVDDSAAAFTRFNLAMRDLNRPATDTVDLIEGLQASAIVAGVSTQELTGSMIQLGQALASGKLQGDEFRTLRENMPAFLRDVAQALGTDMATLMSDAEKGLLTPARLIPAMLSASANARRELASFPLTMARSFSVLRVTATRFLADIDRITGLSRGMAAVFSRVADAVERWRGYLPGIEAWINRLGGMGQIARSFAGALAVLTAGVLAYRAAAIAAAIAQYIWLLPWIAVAAAIVALGVLLADFVAWVSGEDMDTLFGSWFGDFDTFIAPFRQAWVSLKDWVVATLGAIGAEFQRFWEHGQIQETMRLFGAVAGLVMEAWAPVKQFFIDLWEGVVGAFNTAWETIQPIINAIRAAMAWMEDPLGRRRPAATGGAEGALLGGTGTGTVAPPPPGEPASPGRRTQGLRNRRALDALREGGVSPGAGLETRMPGAPQVNATQTNTITIEQVIQATGVNPAEIAAAARSGVQQAGGAVGQSQDAFGRSIAAANPRTEPATR